MIGGPSGGPKTSLLFGSDLGWIWTGECPAAGCMLACGNFRARRGTAETAGCGGCDERLDKTMRGLCAGGCGAAGGGLFRFVGSGRQWGWGGGGACGTAGDDYGEDGVWQDVSLGAGVGFGRRVPDAEAGRAFGVQERSRQSGRMGGDLCLGEPAPVQGLYLLGGDGAAGCSQGRVGERGAAVEGRLARRDA